MPRQISPETLNRMVREGQSVFLLDVRQPWEHDHCRLEGSTLIPLGDLPERLHELEIPPEATVVVYCHHGVRSLSGAAILEASGIPQAFSLQGGIESWSVRIDPSVPRY